MISYHVVIVSTKPTKSKASSVRDFLLMEMTEHRIPVGGRLPSEAELMERFSVSRTTVRQALSSLTSDGLVERRQGSGTYRVSPGSRRRPSERSLLAGVWFNRPTGPFYGPMAAGIRDELTLWDYHAVFEGGTETGAQRRGIDSLVRKGMDGFIVSPSSDPGDPHDPIVEILNRKLPLVLIDKRLPHYQTDLVCTNNQLGAERLTHHLIDLGHRRIGFIGTRGVSTVEDRVRGFRMMMIRHDLPIDPRWSEVSEEVYVDYGRKAAQRILSLPPENRPTAIFGVNDPIAETVSEVARQMGLHVPKDLSVVGFDNAGFDVDQRPWLTTYAQPTYRIGQQAAQLLMRRIQEPVSQTETILLEGRLVVRESTAPPPALD